MILKNCTFFNENFEKEYGDIEIENGKIKQIGILDGDGKDMTGKIIIPGFIDVHIHGCAGGDASDADKSGLEKMAKQAPLPFFQDRSCQRRMRRRLHSREYARQ